MTILKTIEVPTDVYHSIEEICQQKGIDQKEVLNRALMLLKNYHQAEQQGHSVVVMKGAGIPFQKLTLI